MKRLLIFMFGLVVLAGTTITSAVSDGHYAPQYAHCKGSDDNSDNPTYANPQCHSLWISITDSVGHEYFGVGPRQTPDGTAPNTVDVWFDPGSGVKYAFVIDDGGISGPAQAPGTAADPSTGLHLRFQADDQLDPEGFGEHDSSEYVNNGPSDGGGIELNLEPASVMPWLASLSSLKTFLANPVPVAMVMLVAALECADGLCMSFTTARRVAFQGGDKHHHRDVFNYEGVEWDPYNCSGPDDESYDRHGNFACATPKHKRWTLADWNRKVGTTYVEPGFQIYEDPDPEGSPGVIGLFGIPQDDPYPIPALYVGSCGVVLGGGPAMQVPDSPNTNSAHQFVLPTQCG